MVNNTEEKNYFDKKYDSDYNSRLGQLEAEKSPIGGVGDIKDAEKNPASVSNPMNYNPGGQNKKKTGGIKSLIKGRAGIFAGVGGLLIALIAIGFFLMGPAMILSGVASSIITRNDTSSRLFRARHASTFKNMVEKTDIECPNTARSFSCRGSRVSNRLLSDLRAQGIEAEGLPETDRSSRRGYPEKRPTHYRVTLSNGNTQRVLASELTSVIRSDTKLSAKIFGSRGLLASNRLWSGKHIVRKFYRPFGIQRSSPLSKLANNTGLGRKLTAADFRERLSSHVKSIPGFNSPPNMSDELKRRVEKNTNRAKKAGPAYLLAAAGCIVSKAPSFIASGVAAIQLAQLMPLITDIVLAPESRMRSAAIEPDGQAFTSNEMEMIGTLLTEQTPRASDGKMTAAVDSIYLQQAMGVNTNTVPVSEYAPGYKILNENFAIRAGVAVGDAVDPLCDIILSTPAMYTALAVDLAATGAASLASGGLFGVVRAGANFVIGQVVITATTALAIPAIAPLADDLLHKLVDDIPEARGEQLGDILGVSALSFFGAGSMSNMATALRLSDVEYANQQIAQLEDEQRQYDIASLSPFDISSQYTFAGSIVHSLQKTAIVNGAASNPIVNSFGSILRQAGNVISGNQVRADTKLECYSAEFAQHGDNPVCFNSAGMPVSYQTETQASMSTERAMEIIDESGWIDDTVEISDGATLQDMLDAGYIKEDTLLSEWVTTCGQDLMESGDYIMSVDGCAASSPDEIPPRGPRIEGYSVYEDEREEELVGEVSRSIQSADELQLQAITPALVGFISNQIMNGENEEETSGASGSGEVVMGDSQLTADGWAYPTDSPSTACGFDCYSNHVGMDVTGKGISAPFYAARDGVVVQAGNDDEMNERLCANLGLGDIWKGPNQSVRIRHENVNGVTYITRYSHLKNGSITVSTGDTVKAGQKIGEVGLTGCTTGVHAHMEIRLESGNYNGIPHQTRYGIRYVDPTDVYGRVW